MTTVTFGSSGEVSHACADMAKGLLEKTCKTGGEALAEKSRGSKPKTGSFKKCIRCEKEMWVHKYNTVKKFCSRDCFANHKRIYDKVLKQCKQCSKTFVWNDRPRSNSKGVYCSLECRNLGYANVASIGDVTERRSRWRSVRKAFIKKGNDFCALCGIREARLHVHHVIPYKVSYDNTDNNLVTVCPKCHARCEKSSRNILKLEGEHRKLAVLIFQADMQDFWLINKEKYPVVKTKVGEHLA